MLYPLSYGGIAPICRYCLQTLACGALFAPLNQSKPTGQDSGLSQSNGLKGGGVPPIFVSTQRKRSTSAASASNSTLNSAATKRSMQISKNEEIFWSVSSSCRLDGGCRINRWSFVRPV